MKAVLTLLMTPFLVLGVLMAIVYGGLYLGFFGASEFIGEVFE